MTASRDAYLAPGDDGPREAVEFLDATGEGEIYPPADHPLVLTVGDADPSSSVGPTADRRVKPDVLLEDSRAFFTDGQVSAGSSNAAAYLAGVVAVLKAAEPSLATAPPPPPRQARPDRLPRPVRRDNPPQSIGRGVPVRLALLGHARDALLEDVRPGTPHLGDPEPSTAGRSACAGADESRPARDASWSRGRRGDRTSRRASPAGL